MEAFIGFWLRHECAGTRWQLCLFKNGSTAEEHGWISVTLKYCGSKLAASELDAKFEIAILNQKVSERVKCACLGTRS